MRPIKFRGKREDNGEWVYGSLLGQSVIVVDYDTYQNINQYNYNYLIKVERYIVTLESVGQFTGLFDKNGKEIYEGDIVKRMVTDCCICSNDNSCCDEDNCPKKEEYRDVVTMERFPRYWLENESFGYEGEDLRSPEDSEIIGNIHDNPELINTKYHGNKEKNI